MSKERNEKNLTIKTKKLFISVKKALTVNGNP